MYKIIELEQNTPEWLEWREGKATASQSPSVMGESKYFPHTMYEMYLIHTGQAEKPFYNKAMQRGHEFEDEARELANRELSANYQPVLAESEQYENFAASLDGFDPMAKNPILEVKTTKEGGAIWENGLDIYHWQLTHQCAVMGCDTAILWAYDPDTKTGKPMHFKVKKADIKKLVKAWAKYFSCLENFEIPPLCDRDWRDGDKDDFLTSLVISYEKVLEEIKELESTKKEIQAKIKEHTQGFPTKCLGRSIQIVNRKGGVDYKAIPQLEGVDLDQYRKQPTSYFLIK